MFIQINGAMPFKAPKERFCIGQTSSGYTLAYSVDGINFTNYSEATSAYKDVIVKNAIPGMWLKLSGNIDNGVLILY